MKWFGSTRKQVFNQWLEGANRDEMKEYIQEKERRANLDDLSTWQYIFVYAGLIGLMCIFAFCLVSILLFSTHQLDYQHGQLINTMQSEVIAEQAKDICSMNGYGDYLSSGIDSDGSYHVYCKYKTLGYVK